MNINDRANVFHKMMNDAEYNGDLVEIVFSCPRDLYVMLSEYADKVDLDADFIICSALFTKLYDT